MTMTTVLLEGAVEVDVAVPPANFAAMMGGAIQQGAPIMEVPLLAGSGYIITHQVVGFSPKGSATWWKVGQRAQMQQTRAKAERKRGGKA